MLDWGRELARDLAGAEAREWLCTNGIGGFASGTIAGTLTRRYHGLLVAALAPPLGRTLLVAKVEDAIAYGGQRYALSTDRWADGTVAPRGWEAIERFRLDGTTPVWTYAVSDARLEKRIWMEQGRNTTYVHYGLERGSAPAALAIQVLVNYRDYHGSTRGSGWSMGIEPVANGIRVQAFEGARPFVVLARRATATLAHAWYEGVRLVREEERGLDAGEDHLHAATLEATLGPGETITVVCSAETAPDLDGEAAWDRRQRQEARLLERFRENHGTRRRGGFADASLISDSEAHLASRLRLVQPPPPDGRSDQALGFLDRLALAADQFVVARPVGGDADGVSIIAGYHWFGDWGRDTMISLPGLTIAAGRSDLTRRVLTTFAPYADRGMLPNRFPEGGETLTDSDYNTVDAALWYIEAVRAYHAATKDDATLAELFPVLEEIVRWYRQGTRFGIAEDPADGLIRSGEPGVQLTWMDAKAGDWVVTPRTGKAVEINALWYNALAAMRTMAEGLGRPADPWVPLAARVRGAFGRFWNESTGCCYDVIDGPEGNDPAIRPNQIFAVSLPASPWDRERQRRIVEACGRHLLTSLGLRSLAPGDPRYRGRYEGGVGERDGAYHQGTVWAWLLGPFALAHFRVHGRREIALGFLGPMIHHLGDYGLGSIAEIFDGDAPFAARGCVAQAWSVAETLRAWMEITNA